MNRNERLSREAVEMLYIEDWEAGRNPTLQDYVNRYPYYAEHLAEFIISFLELEGDLARTPQPTEASPAVDRAIERALGMVSARPATVREARKALGWSVEGLSQKVGIPAVFISTLEDGKLLSWTNRFATRMSEAMGRSADVMAALMSASVRTTAPAHLRAGVQTRSLRSRSITFQELLEQCDRNGILTDEQRQEWLTPDAGD